MAMLLERRNAPPCRLRDIDDDDDDVYIDVYVP